jgi:hypothetical protein
VFDLSLAFPERLTRGSTSTPAVAAAFLSPTVDRATFAARWHLLDLKHDIRSLDLRQLTAKRTDGHGLTAEGRALADFVQLTQESAGIGFVTALDGATWAKLDRKQRAQIRSPQEFCFERLLRQVFDRLDAQEANGMLTLVVPLERRAWETRLAALEAALARDTRTDHLLTSVTFCSPAFDRRLDAARILQASMRAELRRKAVSRKAFAAHSLTAWAVQSTICEIWDAETCKRRLSKLDWDTAE